MQDKKSNYNNIDIDSFAIESNRLRLVPIKDSHILEVYKNFTEDISKLMYLQPQEDVTKYSKRIHELVHNNKMNKDLQLVIIDRATKEFYGMIGLYDINTPIPGMLNTWLKKSAHHQGFGIEAGTALLSWAKENLEFDHIYYIVEKHNIASQNIPLKNGGRLIKEYPFKNMNGEELEAQEYWIKKGEN